jgi:RNA polymerase sigma-70 factor (ECF subfamily)
VRLAVDVIRERAPGGDDGALEQLATDDDPELTHVRRLYGAELKGAFQEALQKLPPREATLLKLHFIEGMPAGDVGRLYGVNGRTVQRWLADSRARVLQDTREALRGKLGLTSSQLRSVVKLARSQLDASVRRLLSKR